MLLLFVRAFAICRQSCRRSRIGRRSQLFADRPKYLPTELPRSQICRRSKMIADRAAGAKYLPTEKPNLPTERHLCRRSYRKSKFADGASYLPTEPHICQRSYRKSQICRRSRVHDADSERRRTQICCRTQIIANGAAAVVNRATGPKFAVFACCMFYCFSIF